MGKWSHRVAHALRERGHDVVLWFDRDVCPRSAGAAGQVLVYPLRLTRAIARARDAFDVVVIHEPGGFWYALARKVCRRLPPVVVMSHGVENRWFRERVRARRRGFAALRWTTVVKTPLFRMWQTGGAIRLADHVICLSSDDRDYLTRVIGLSGTRVTRVANGVGPDDFVPPGDRRPSHVLFVGGWLDNKGARVLPQVLRRVGRERQDVRLTIAGSGTAPAGVLADFADPDRARVTVVPGRLDAESMRRLYASHGVFFMPSLFEGSPLSLLEAMAAGCAVVAARVGGVPDVVRDGTDGLLFPVMDVDSAAAQLIRVLGDEPLASALGRAAVDRVRAFSWRETATGVERAAQAALAAR
jgi:glycosyltransferase involved in cell wall biosynthesis